MNQLEARSSNLYAWLSVFVSLLVCVGPMWAQDLALSVSPDPATPGDPLTVTVTGVGGEETCPFILDPFIGHGVVTIPFRTDCFMPPPPPGPFAVQRLVGPLNAGNWELRLQNRDLDPPEVVATASLTVLDPRFAIELDASTVGEGDVITGQVRGLASCAFLDEPEVEPGRIQFPLRGLGICDPPPPEQFFQQDLEAGPFPPGDYEVELVFRRFDGDDLVAATTLSVLPEGSCVPGRSTLCLSDGRFEVEAYWMTSDGVIGEARAVEETVDTGLFWFFNPENIEMVVKVIDACSTAFESFWFFAGGLTDVAVFIEVTDTVSGEVKTYGNELGQPFTTITDTAAFMTCP